MSSFFYRHKFCNSNNSITEALTHATFLSHQIIIIVMLTVGAHMGCFCTSLLTVYFITTPYGQTGRRKFWTVHADKVVKLLISN